MPRVVTKLVPNKSGGFVARKRIPEDVQTEYERLYGVRWEARFTWPPGMPIRLVSAQHREWVTEIETRIANIRAERTGEGQKLSPKDARALAGEWYQWYLERRQAHPEALQYWEWLKEDTYDKVREEVLPYANNPDEDTIDTILQQCAAARADIRPLLSDVCETAQFLSARKLILDAPSRDMFLDALHEDFFAAVNLFIRRAKNDYTPDTYPLKFPKFSGVSDAGLSSWPLFERWVEMQKPARATVDRWRGVFLRLAEDFGDRSTGNLTTDEAQDWADGLITSERTPRTVRDVWIVAARTVFGWAKDRKLITTNPFTEVKVSVPRSQAKRETKAFHRNEYTTILKAANAVTDTRRVGAAARRWVPWLCAYTGARVGEITQLRAEDVFQQDGVNAIRITPEAGTVKTRQTRVVPLHEHLVEQGFLHFARTKGKGPLFYDVSQGQGCQSSDEPTNPRKPRYVKVREHLAQWVRSLGINDRELQPNHAWRHTFKQIADRTGISERMSDSITGHAPKSIGASYGAPTLQDMAAALHKFPRYGPP
jgi:integrase